MKRALRFCSPLVAALVLFSLPLVAQQKLLTLDDIYGTTNRVNFSGTPAPAFVWIDGDHYAWPRPGAERGLADWMSVDAATGSASPLFDAARAESQLAALPGVGTDAAKRAVHSRDIVFN